MGKKLFVGGLAWATTDDRLREAFGIYGTVTEAKVICDRETGKSRGFGFVTFEDDAAADEAREKMNGGDLDGRTIRIDSADVKNNNGNGGNGGNNRRQGGYRGNNRQGGHRRQNAEEGGERRDNRNRSHNDNNNRYAEHSENTYDDESPRENRRHNYNSMDYNHYESYVVSEPTRGGRDNRKRDRKSERDEREDRDW